jgi:hypothetical protein
MPATLDPAGVAIRDRMIVRIVACAVVTGGLDGASPLAFREYLLDLPPHKLVAIYHDLPARFRNAAPGDAP